MDAQRIRQTVIGILILVALSLLWGRGQAPESSNHGEAASTSVDAKPPLPASQLPADERPTAGANADFDYYLLVLSWSPTHCSSDAGHGADDDLQCRSGRPYGFVLHGFWPQNERGYPQNCSSSEPRTVADDVVQEMMKISPSADLVEHEWQKHGTCSGLSQRDYFAVAARAFRAINIPSAYVRPTGEIQTRPDDVREAFLASNPSLSRGSVAATCNRNELAEVWECLDKALQPRACSS